MIDYMKWRIVLRSGRRHPAVTQPRAGPPALPASIITLAPYFRHENMPQEVALLLPANDGPKRLVDQVTLAPQAGDPVILGLFLAQPFLNVTVKAKRLREAGVCWVANLPSIEQQDQEFTQQLADVGLDRARELDSLAAFQACGLSTAVVVTDAAGATAAAAIRPEALIILPRVADFAAGFPSLRQRGAAALAVAEAARAAGWSGLLLGLAEGSEAAHEALWPDPLDGVVCRPVAF